MEIKCTAWNPSKHENMCQGRWLEPECYKDPVNATDNAINLAEIALKVGDCNPNVKTTITLPLDEYRLLISDAQKKAKEEGCKEGREEAWDLARRIVTYGPPDTYTNADLRPAFGSCSPNDIFNLPPGKAIEKDRAYQKEKNKLHVGDEVKFRSTNMPCGYVVETRMSEYVKVLKKDRTTSILKISDLAKTGNVNEDLVEALSVFDE